MINFILFLIIIALTAASIFSVFFALRLFQTGVPFIPTPDPIVEKMIELAELTSEKKFVDLGCGEGKIVRAAGKLGARGSGYELIKPLVWYSTLRNKLENLPIEFRSDDFFTANLENIDVIFCYLWPSAMKKFWENFGETLTPGTKIISHAFEIPQLTPEKIEEMGKSKIFVYRVGAQIPAEKI
ncbi:class I SAM-dependent methyltransferase [bacterium]|jgi:hypothetical protein|nr:class I SAM-dependent methyltransferase [bacterium]MBT6832168.1 class I SAM-dependent methyltransferase [bacterium]MBT6996386.1 class I SAM-dependent methyltransferase [bacterium]MBT7772121.1 class I SAM-dependent methyltransferase [bacterium]